MRKGGVVLYQRTAASFGNPGKRLRLLTVVERRTNVPSCDPTRLQLPVVGGVHTHSADCRDGEEIEAERAGVLR